MRLSGYVKSHIALVKATSVSNHFTTHPIRVLNKKLCHCFA